MQQGFSLVYFFMQMKYIDRKFFGPQAVRACVKKP